MSAQEIVRALAAVEDWARWSTCGLCGTDGHMIDVPAKHVPSCPWRLAREWVAAHPLRP